MGATGFSLSQIGDSEREECTEFIEAARDLLYNNLRRRCPVLTGALRRSIRVDIHGIGDPCFATLYIRMLFYGWYQNRFNGKHKGWIDQTIQETQARIRDPVPISGNRQ